MKLFTGNSMHGVLDELVPQFERSTGHKVAVIYDPAQIILKRVEAGETADLAILGRAVLEALVKQGKITADSQRTIARCGVGIGVRAGAHRPDISSTDALTRALLGAKSIAYTTSGASGIHFARVIERLGIAEQVKAKGVTRPGGLVGELVASGEAEIAVQQIPEIMAVAGVELVGPLPPELQNMTTSAAGIFVDSKEHAGAQALLDFLSTPASARVFKAKGLEPA